MSEALNFTSFSLNILKNNHPLFRYTYLTTFTFEPYIHQSEMYYRLLLRDPIRFLIADDVGLGKTIEAIMIMDQLIRKRNVKKILILLPKNIILQWKEENLDKFVKEWNLLVRVYGGKNTNISDNGIYIASLDTFKRKDHLEKFKNVNWDLILVDEIHKVGIQGNKETHRFKALSEISKNYNVNFIGMSATPHKGDEKDYLKRLTFIDPYFNERGDLIKSTVKALILRRTKKSVNEVYERAQIFPEAYFSMFIQDITDEERNYYSLLVDLGLSIVKEASMKGGKEAEGIQLLGFLIGRRALSSPKAGLITLNNIIQNRANILREDEVEEGIEEYAEDETISERTDIDEFINNFVAKNASLLSKYRGKIEELTNLAKRIMKNDSRINAVITLVREHLEKGDKVIIFTDYKDTAEYVFEKIKERLPPEDNENIKVLHSGNIEKEGIENIKNWLKGKGKKVLVSTDVASEGLNLQDANVLIHYELPLSIVKFEQRNGRVYRLKQLKPVYIYYISLKTPLEENLIEKYFSKLLSIAYATRSDVNVTSSVVVGLKDSKPVTFDLSNEKEDIILNTGYYDPQSNQRITSQSIFTSALKQSSGEGLLLDDIVNSLIDRIMKFRKAVKRYGLMVSQDIQTDLENYVRKLAGFDDRKDMANSLLSLVSAIVKSLGGELVSSDGRSVKIRPPNSAPHVINSGLIGDILRNIKNLLFNREESHFIVSDAIDYSIYIVNADVKLGDKVVLTLPLFIKQDGEIIKLSQFLGDILPKVIEGKSARCDVYLVDNKKYEFNVKSKLLDIIRPLSTPYISYRSQRGRDNWKPQSLDDFKIILSEPQGGIIGVKGLSSVNQDEVISNFQKGGFQVSIQDTSTQGSTLRVEGSGRVMYLKVVPPTELLTSKKSCSYVRDSLVIV